MGKSKLTKPEVLWLGVIFWAVAFTAAEAPFSFAFQTRLQDWQVVSDAIISILFLIDLIYHIRQRAKQKNKDMTTGGLWAYRALLAVDILACIPFDVLAYFTGVTHSIYLLKWLRLFRLVRIVKLFHFVNSLKIVPKFIKMQMFLFLAIILVHLIACVWIWVQPPAPGLDVTTAYIDGVYWVITTLTTIGYGDITPITSGAKIFAMVIMITGVIFYGVVIGNVTKMITDGARYKEQANEKFNDLQLFMKHYNIPGRLQTTAFDYYNHLFTKRLSNNDQKIIGELPQALQAELKTYMNMKLIKSVPIFKNCSLPCLKEVASSLEQMNYSPGQNVINIGEHGEEMFIIAHGVCEVILTDGNIVATLHDGQFFGEIALIEETTRTANVRAQSYCDLYKLQKEDFLRIIKTYPELLEGIKDTTKRRKSDK
jgi:hypothetical protein